MASACMKFPRCFGCGSISTPVTSYPACSYPYPAPRHNNTGQAVSDENALPVTLHTRQWGLTCYFRHLCYYQSSVLISSFVLLIPPLRVCFYVSGYSATTYSVIPSIFGFEKFRVVTSRTPVLYDNR